MWPFGITKKFFLLLLLLGYELQLTHLLVLISIMNIECSISEIITILQQQTKRKGEKCKNCF